MKIGFLINPIAGMGGSVALKGTDGEETLRRALELGALPRSPERARAAVRELAEAPSEHTFYAPSGIMGADILSEYGIKAEIISLPSSSSKPEDTKRAAEEMKAHGVDLIVFAGGDGTARDICSVIGESIPVIGIPAGVKIHSGVYAKRPCDAGRLTRNFLINKVKRFSVTEVVDIDEEAFRDNIVRARLYGYMNIPDDREYMQERKAGSAGKEAEVTSNLALYIVKEMKPGALYLIGSGSTTSAVTKHMGINGTLLGVDAVSDKQLLGKDLTAKEIAEILSKYESNKRYLIITIIGGQGHIFGRGNQQLSPAVLRLIPKENIIVIATPGKLSQLFGKSLIADTGDTDLDKAFSGYIAVTTGFGQRTMTRIG